MTAKFIFLSLSLLCQIKLVSQFNYVNDPDFQIPKENHSPPTSCLYNNVTCEQIGDDNETWNHAPRIPRHCYSNKKYLCSKCPTADWIEANNTPNSKCSEAPSTPSSRFCGGSGGDDETEGINSLLKEKLKSGKYIIKVKIACSKSGTPKDQSIDFFLSEKRFNWNNDDNKLKCGTVTFERNLSPFWIDKEIKFEIPANQGNKLNVFTISPSLPTGYVFWDRIELFEDGCESQLLIENRVYDFPDEGKYEALKITSGFDANEPRVTNGDVKVNANTHLEYKASEEINLLPGFESSLGSEFWAHIAPCGSPCEPPNLNLQDLIVVCNEECKFIGTNGSNANEYEWSADPQSAMEYLKYTNTGNPLFCPPTTGNGMVKYTVRIKNSCGEIAYKSLWVRYQKTVNNSPVFSIVSTDMQQSKVRITLKVSDETEAISVFLLDCNTNGVIKSFNYTAGKDFTGEDFEFNFEDNCLNPCQCLKWKICTRNFCSTAEYCNTIPWNRSTAPKFVIPTVVFCDDDGFHFCFYTEGVVSAKVSIFNRWGQHLDDNTGNSISERVLSGNCNTKCIIINKQTYDGVYFSKITFTDCSGNTQTINEPLTFLPCGEFVFSNDTNITDVKNTEFFVKNENNEVIDSVYFTFSPNPVSELLTMMYHLPIAANVTIKVYSPQTGNTKEFLSNYTSQAGNFSYDISVDDLPFGYNYLFLEVKQTNSITFSKKFMVIH